MRYKQQLIEKGIKSLLEKIQPTGQYDRLDLCYRGVRGFERDGFGVNVNVNGGVNVKADTNENGKRSNGLDNEWLYKFELVTTVESLLMTNEDKDILSLTYAKFRGRLSTYQRLDSVGESTRVDRGTACAYDGFTKRA